MNAYKITHSPVSTNEHLVTFTDEATIADILRGRELAASLRGRHSIRLRGYLLTPARMERWRLLFEAGWMAEPTYHYNIKAWTYSRGPKRNVTLRNAMELTRKTPQPIEV